MSVGRDIETGAYDKASATKDRWWPAGFLKGADGDNARFNFGDGVGERGWLSGENMRSCR
jgi:hypothetical protein